MAHEQNYFQKYILITTFVLSILSTVLIYEIFVRDKPVTKLLNHYDYIVVGGGTTGCVLASRLSENKSTSVLLIEAGDYFNIFSTIPLLAVMLQGTKYDWSFKSESQKFSSFGLHEQKQALPRGKGLGGSNQINYMIHGENMLDDFKNWTKFGITDWNYNKIHFYLHNILKNNYDLLENCMSNYDGILNKIQLDAAFNLTETKSELSDLLKLAVTESQEMNVSYSSVKSTIFGGQRWTSYHSHLQPALERSNLHILLNTQVTKILFKNKDAVGVQSINNYNIKRNIYSKNDIILSSGTFMNPKILMSSGIGPTHILKKNGIRTLINLPGVGRNLHDHLSMPLYVSIDKPVSVTVDKILRFKEFWNYIIYKQGVFSTTPIVGLAKGSSNSGLILFGLGSTDEKYLREIANLKLETFKSLFPLYKNTSQEGFVFLSTCLKPKSRGYVSLHSFDIKHDPIINPQYLSKYKDIDCMIEAVKLADKMIQTDAFKNVGAKLHWPIFKNCSHLAVDINNYYYLECIIRTAALTMHHPGGTCRIGNNDDRMTVVDHLLRVKGVTGLRILDASILPEPLSTFPNSVLTLMAEYASNIIINN